MSETARESYISKNRLEALVDGVFAFAMTLLVLSLSIASDIPKALAAQKVPEMIAAMRPEFVSFLTAFFILGAFWIHHHRQFHELQSADGVIVKLTFLILICVVLIPFSTSVSGDYSGVQLAVVIFHLNLFVMGMFFLSQWYYIARADHLVSAPVRGEVAYAQSARLLLCPVIALTGIAVSFVTPSWSMAIYLLMIPGAYLIRWTVGSE